jgi:hypothetical protein
MEELIRFLQRYEIWIYFLMGAVGIIYIQKLFRNYREWHSSLYGMEKENAQRRINASLSIIILLALLTVTEFILVSFVVPLYPHSAGLATPTIIILTTPTVTLAPGQTAPAGTPAPAPVLAGKGCIPGQVEWTAPISGADISGAVELKGTVNLPDLAFYKYEYTQPGNETWTTLAGGNTVKKNETLGTWNTTDLVPGDYRLRLVVYNTQNQQLAPCELAVRVTKP